MEVDAPAVTPCTRREQLSQLHTELRSKLAQCTACLVSLYQAPTTQTRSIRAQTTEARRIVDVEAGALLQACEDGHAEDDNIIASQYGTTTVNVRKIQSCCACSMAPICNLLLPCCHGVCSAEACISLLKCPMCCDKQPLERIAQLNIYTE